MSDKDGVLPCPCQGETKVHIDREDGECVFQVRCEKCGANGDCYIGAFGYDTAIEDWNREMRQGYVPHAGGKMRGVIVV